MAREAEPAFLTLPRGDGTMHDGWRCEGEALLTDEQRRSLDWKGVDWRRVTYVEGADVLDALRRGGALVVDVRRTEHYIQSHFTGAVAARSREELIELPRDYELFLYCT